MVSAKGRANYPSPSGRSPMVGFLLIVQVSDSSNKWSVALFFCPIDCFSLRLEGGEGVVGVVFHDIVIYMAAFGSAFRASLDINVGHSVTPVSSEAK